MSDYYDGPREGVALFRGSPHLYVSEFDYQKEDVDRFQLYSIDDATLALEVAQWARWTRWHEAFESGHTTVAHHPALPDDREAYQAAEQRLTVTYQTIQKGPPDALAYAEWKGLSMSWSQDSAPQVRWTTV